MFFSPYFGGLLFDSKPTILVRIWTLTVHFNLQSEKCMMEFERQKKIKDSLYLLISTNGLLSFLRFCQFFIPLSSGT